MKQLFRIFFRRLGLEVVSAGNVRLRYLTHPSLTPFDEVLLRAFPSLHGLSFIQIGANDGRRVDPIYRCIEEFGWRGIFLEPDPRFFAQLQETHRGRSGLVFVNAALDVAGGEKELYVVQPDLAGLPDWVQGVGSLRREHVAEVVAKLGLPSSAVTSRLVASVTWDDVFTKLGPAQPDVIVIDTEGHDRVLVAALDFSRHRPRVLQFEHAHASIAERLEIHARLMDAGYEIVTSDMDTIAYRPALPAR